LAIPINSILAASHHDFSSLRRRPSGFCPRRQLIAALFADQLKDIAAAKL
jgi:hypothetical protein